ncbi:MAG: Hpt domain-containing protein [Flavobacteriales bacterium]|nr:Hpt domain-containing protein [Flavobacteriales bacterium]
MKKTNTAGSAINQLYDSSDLFNHEKVEFIGNILNNDITTIQKFYNKFSNVIDDFTPKIKNNFSAGNRKECLKQIDTFKGSALTAGADKLSKSLSKLEYKMKANGDLTEMENQLAEAIELADQTKNSLNESLDSFV